MPRQTSYSLESSIERSACRFVESELGVYSVKFNTWGGDTGFPDRIFFIPGGRPVFVEFKRPGGRLSPKQEYQIKRLRKLGYIVEVCYSVSETYEKVKAAMDSV